MANITDVCLSLGEVAKLFGTFTIVVDGNVTVNISIEKKSGDVWNTYYSFSDATQTVSADIANEFSNFGTYTLATTEEGTYRWFVTITYADIIETSYIYFQVIDTSSIVAPTLYVYDEGDGKTARIVINDGDDAAVNNIYLRERYGEYKSEPDLIIAGNDASTIELVPGPYYGKVISNTDSGVINGTTDPVAFRIFPIQEESEDVVKNIINVQVESVTNTFFGNQFLAYFLQIPQVGYYQDEESKTLKSYVTDRINESIRGVQLPETAIQMMSLPYFGHQTEKYMGIGDGELGQISIRLKLDRYLQNYTSLLNWSYLKYDWTFGGKNPNNQMTDHDLWGTFIVEFLDAEEQRTRKMGYKLLIDSLPGLPLAVDSPEEIEYEALFRVVEMDTSQFVMGEPLNDPVRIF